ncbi:hypothetical protein BKA66DRAFT_605970 [Pyrenochaeta sp. MPI-SDFR-AT-0127]|nr:hypothetical protein BKA66DRAFT_605970 [Pyrenochaeta sp. MPI-SDFR-AT-0127]
MALLVSPACSHPNIIKAIAKQQATRLPPPTLTQPTSLKKELNVPMTFQQPPVHAVIRSSKATPRAISVAFRQALPVPRVSATNSRANIGTQKAPRTIESVVRYQVDYGKVTEPKISATNIPRPVAVATRRPKPRCHSPTLKRLTNSTIQLRQGIERDDTCWNRPAMQVINTSTEDDDAAHTLRSRRQATMPEKCTVKLENTDNDMDEEVTSRRQISGVNLIRRSFGLRTACCPRYTSNVIDKPRIRPLEIEPNQKLLHNQKRCLLPVVESKKQAKLSIGFKDPFTRSPSTTVSRKAPNNSSYVRSAKCSSHLELALDARSEVERASNLKNMLSAQGQPNTTLPTVTLKSRSSVPQSRSLKQSPIICKIEEDCSDVPETNAAVVNGREFPFTLDCSAKSCNGSLTLRPTKLKTANKYAMARGHGYLTTAQLRNSSLEVCNRPSTVIASKHKRTSIQKSKVLDSKPRKPVLISCLRQPVSDSKTKRVRFIEKSVIQRYYERNAPANELWLDDNDDWTPLKLDEEYPGSPQAKGSTMFELSGSDTVTLKQRVLSRFKSVQEYEKRRKLDAVARDEILGLGQLEYGNADFKIALQSTKLITAHDIGVFQNPSEIGMKGIPATTFNPDNGPLLVFGAFKVPFTNVVVPTKTAQAFKKPLI